MPFHLASRRCKTETVQNRFPGAEIIDVTSKTAEPWVRFSPFFPHGEIPAPNSQDVTSQSVEGLWQGLKVFETEDIDTSKFAITNMKGIKRSVRSRGRVLGHRFGVESSTLLPYQAARYEIYLPAYRWILDNRLTEELRELAALSNKSDVVLLDYETNNDVRNLSKPLSHASLVIAYLNDGWPSYR